MNLSSELEKQLDFKFSLKEKRPGIFQIFAPFYHEDGDMFDIFIEKQNGKVIISDYGMTLMRLSYVYDLDTPNKEKIFNRIINTNRINISNGKLFIETTPDRLKPAVLQFLQTITKVSNMKLYQREVVQNLFFEILDEFISEKLNKYNPKKQYYPIPQNTEYEVDYCFNNIARPIFLFGINSPSNAKLATISCLKFQNEKVKFRSVMVLENIDVLSKKDLSRLMSISDKEFPSFKDFEMNAEQFFEREYSN